MGRGLVHRLSVGLLVCAAFQLAQADMPADEAAQAERYRVVRAALQLRDVPLGVHASCAQAAPQLPARTIGDYLAGFLAAMGDGRNQLSTRCRPASGAARCELWLKHADDEDKWAWGVAFQLDRRGRPRPSSVECLGAG